MHPVRRDQLTALVRLCHEHAAYDRAFEPGIAAPPEDLAHRLERSVFERGELCCCVAERGGALLGYVSGHTATSTWRGDHYLVMDCLYVREGHRGHGIGGQLLDAMCATATTVGATRLRWQTPLANEGSNRFYRRLGAEHELGHADKRVYTIELGG